MIRLYSWGTPNGTKIHMMLEELGQPYELHPVDLGKGEQHKAAFVAISPNSKIPGIVDPDGPGGAPLSLFESGAILIYLADKFGRLLATEGAARYTAIQWVMFQMANVGPYFGQLNHFVRHAPDNAYALARYRQEDQRLLRVLDARLAQAPYLAGANFTIADICTWPWVRSFRTNHGADLPALPHVERWFEAIAARPATARALAVTERLRGQK